MSLKNRKKEKATSMYHIMLSEFTEPRQLMNQANK